MKKTILLTILLSLSIATFAQESTNQEKTPEEKRAEQMEYINNFKVRCNLREDQMEEFIKISDDFGSKMESIDWDNISTFEMLKIIIPLSKERNNKMKALLTKEQYKELKIVDKENTAKFKAEGKKRKEAKKQSKKK